MHQFCGMIRAAPRCSGLVALDHYVRFFSPVIVTGNLALIVQFRRRNGEYTRILTSPLSQIIFPA